jgi:hypothetical protein
LFHDWHRLAESHRASAIRLHVRVDREQHSSPVGKAARLEVESELQHRLGRRDAAQLTRGRADIRIAYKGQPYAAAANPDGEFWPAGLC